MCGKLLKTHLHTQNAKAICNQNVAMKNIYA